MTESLNIRDVTTVVNNFHDICRLCLKADSFESVSILAEAESNQKYSSMVFDLMSIYIDESDTLPKLICTECAQNLLLFYQFKQKCESSERKLSTLLVNASQDCSNIESDHTFSSSESKQLDLLFVGDQHEADYVRNTSNASPAISQILEYEPIQCDKCGQTFTQKSSLLQHRLVHEQGKTFECQICHQKFTRKSHVRIHMRRHTNLAPYTCKVCPAAFKKSSDLRRHERVHSNRRDYVCEVCGKTFKRSTDVRSHMNTHTGEKPFKCKQCPKEYSAHSSMMKHFRKSHSF